MTDPNPAGGGKPDSGGDQEDKSPTVSREHHERVLAEKKKAGERAAKAEAELAERDRLKAEAEEASLLANKKAEEALAKTKKELEESKAKIAAHEAAQLDAKKLHSFNAALGGKVDPKFWNLIDIDQIKIGDDGVIDESSVTAYVTKFKTTYPETIAKPGQGNQMPNDKPQGGGGSLTLEEWNKLPLKEKKARQKEVKLPPTK